MLAEKLNRIRRGEKSCRLARLHRLLEGSHERTHFLNESAILPMLSNTTHNCAAHDHAIGDLSNPRGILRSRHAESHSHRGLGVLSDLGDVLAYARHVL